MLTVDINPQTPLPAVLNVQQLAEWSRLAYLGDGKVFAAASGAEVSIAVVDEHSIRELNRTYRNSDQPTNVLAFPAEMDPIDGIAYLGDIVLCAPIINSEAVEQGKSSAAHWAHMTIHAMLHLQGYDHQQVADANIMESLEIDLLAKINFPNPYEDKNHPIKTGYTSL